MLVRARVRKVGATAFTNKKGQRVTVDTVTLEFEHPIAILVVQCSQEQTEAKVGAAYVSLLDKTCVVPLALAEFRLTEGGTFQRWQLVGDGKPMSNVQAAAA